MDRRSFFRNAALGGAGSLTLAAPAIAQSGPSVQWRCTSSFPKGLDTVYGGAEDIARYVREASAGDFDIQVFAAGEIVPGLQAANAAQNGTVEMCHTAAYYFVGQSPTWALGTVIPFGMNARGMNAWLYYGGGLDALNAFFREQGLHYLPAGNTGTQMGGWFRDEIGGLSDMEGLQMRVAGLGGRIMEALGVVPQQIAGGDVYAALERGAIDATEWVGPYDDARLGFQRVAPYYYYPGWWEGNATLSVFCNSESYEALPEEYRSLLDTAARAANTDMLAEYDYKNPAALRELVDSGAQLRRFPDEVMNAGYDAALDLYSDFRQNVDGWADIYDSMMRFQSEHFLWQQVAEQTFASFMYEKQSNNALPAQIDGAGSVGGTGE
ncbi:Alpha-keto acid-binding periplasmic protein TakP precursor [Roseivivax jejudonensis]|uniref:Alpha-keto acid-binding periplasmic protein TakP n=1 Tax=Roseivivax jejudonensis TaxID=1529041 RepID=A0A1X6ZXQ1_9RHOB|nr:TRAP transporter substrate-binding protein [Roseivivax jejudonensis]SLN62859.1 Alpha-keto acid-binding periplasmic protein TakP precursor [Roseivivax jejudonensis]